MQSPARLRIIRGVGRGHRADAREEALPLDDPRTLPGARVLTTRDAMTMHNTTTKRDLSPKRADVVSASPPPTSSSI